MSSYNTSHSFLMKLAIAAISTLLLFGASQQAKANDLTRLAVSLCESAKSDDRSLMRKKLRSAKIRLRDIYAAISCGADGSLLRVATKAGSINAATFIATKIGKKNLAEAEGDGKNIMQWTEGLISAGDASKQNFAELYASKM